MSVRRIEKDMSMAARSSILCSNSSGDRAAVRARVCICMYVNVCEFVCVCLYACMRYSEMERQQEKARGIEEEKRTQTYESTDCTERQTCQLHNVHTKEYFILTQINITVTSQILFAARVYFICKYNTATAYTYSKAFISETRQTKHTHARTHQQYVCWNDFYFIACVFFIWRVCMWERERSSARKWNLAATETVWACSNNTAAAAAAKKKKPTKRNLYAFILKRKHWQIKSVRRKHAHQLNCKMSASLSFVSFK